MPIILGSTSAGTLGTVTLGEVKSIVQAEGYDVDTTGQQTLMVRSVLRALYGMRRWPFLEAETTAFSATVANQGSVDISTLGRAIKLDAVRIAFGTDYRGDGDIEWLRDVELKNLRHTDREPGYPQKWTRAGSALLLWPIPNATYPLSITYYSLTTLPSADGDSILWPEEHIDIIIYGVIMRLCRRQRDWNGFDRAKQSFTEALRDMTVAAGDHQRQTDGAVRRWSGWDNLS